MSRSHRWSQLVVLLVILSAIGGLSRPGRAQEQVELRVWDQFTDEAEGAAADAIYQAFMDANPNIKITREAIQTQQMQQTVNTALASGTGPDIIFYDAGPGFAGVLVNAGLLAPIDQFAEQYGWADKVTAQALEATSLNGQLYGLPLQVDLIGMYYNQGLLEENGWQPPQTIEELKTLCSQAQEAGYTPMAFSNNPGWQGFHQFSMAANDMIGPDAMRALLYQNQGNWNTPEVVTAIKTFFVDLKDAGCYTEDVNALTYDDGNSLFFTEQSVLHPTGSWLVGDIERNMPDAQVGYVPFPAIDGAQGQYWISGVGSAYYISANSQHQAEAAQFLDFLFTPDMVKQWIEEAGFYVPVQVDTATLEVSELYRSILDTLQTGIGENAQTQFGYNVDVLAPAQFNEVMQNGFQAVISGDKTPEELAAELQAAWEEGMSTSPSLATPTS